MGCVPGQDQGEITRHRALTVFPGMALVAGLWGGMLGIGGGMFMNPLLIEAGVHVQVATSNTRNTLFFLSFVFRALSSLFSDSTPVRSC